MAKAPKRERRKVNTLRATPIAEGLLLVNSSSGRLIACSKCASEICQAQENYKLHCATTERPITTVNPYVLDPKTYVDDAVVLRSYARPSCGLLLATELARPADPPLWDIQLA